MKNIVAIDFFLNEFWIDRLLINDISEGDVTSIARHDVKYKLCEPTQFIANNDGKREKGTGERHSSTGRES